MSFAPERKCALGFLQANITGQVQGVGFRYRARYAAQTLDLTGWAQNEDDGSVTLEVQGDPDKFLSLFAMIQKSDYIQLASAAGWVSKPSVSTSAA